MREITIDQFAVVNILFQFYSFDYFLESAAKIGFRKIDLWTGYPHMLLDNDYEKQCGEIRKKCEDMGLQIANVMPKVIGYGLRDAVFRLENLGLKVKAKGVGKVTMQSIVPGTKIARNQEVIIWLGNRKGNENDSTMTAQNNKDNPRKGNGNDQPKTKAVNPATPQKNGERKG